MLKISGLEKSYGDQTLFENLSLQMNPGERLGLIGRNGHGKTTLFRLILQEERPDQGKISLPDYYRVGHLSQHLHFSESTILAESCLGLPEEERDQTYRAEKILFGLGFSKQDLTRSPQEFSGGYQIRINLAKLLTSEPNLLLLDEPTNYLDIVSIRWLKRFLNAWPQELMLITHDRDFMDAVCTHTAMIHRKKLRKLEGSTQKLREQLAQEETIHEKTRQNEAQQREQLEAFIDRFRSKASKASVVQSRIKQLEKMPERERLEKIASLDFRFQEAPFEAQNCLEAKTLSYGYTDSARLFSDLSFTVARKDRIAIIGKNGKGKSTLLKLISGQFEPTEGTLKTHPALRIGYFGQTNRLELDPKKTIEEEVTSANHLLSRTAVRAICGAMMFSGDRAEKRVSVLSGGEKSRVLLGKILATPSNLLLLDEPSNHLDMESIESLIESLEEFSGAVLIVSHQEEILRRLAKKLIIFNGDRVDFFAGDYAEFLEKIGWEEEKSATKSSESSNKNPNKKELRKKRAELLAARSALLNPLKAKAKKIEEDIHRFEAALETKNQELSLNAESLPPPKMAELGKEIAALRTKVEQAYHDWEIQSREQEKITQDFEAKLAEC